MTLVDKLQDVHLGDLVRLVGSRGAVVGYVHEYTSDTIQLGTEKPYRLLSEFTKGDVKLFGRCPNTVFRDPGKTYHLKFFGHHEILQRYSAD